MKQISNRINGLKYTLVFVFLLSAGFFYAKFTPAARADDAGLVKYGVVFDATNGPGTPNYARIIKKDNVYHMWYEDTGTEFFYHTTSLDGRTWAAGEITVAGDVHEPSILWDSAANKFKMWFEPVVAGLEGTLWYTESSDGLDWDAPEETDWVVPGNAWEDGGRYMPSVIKDGGTYKMWYQSISSVAGEGGDRRINLATSADGLTWDNSGSYHKVTFDGNDNNNIVFGLGDGGSWDSAALYSQVVVKLDSPAEYNYLMLYAAHAGGRYVIGQAPSTDGISWERQSDYTISNEHDIWFPSLVEDGDNSIHYIWYMDSTGGKVYFATLPYGNDSSDESDKAHIDSWSAYRYEDINKSCSSRLKLIIKGKHFDKDAEVKIGGHSASSVDRQSSKKIVAKFCLAKLLSGNTDHKRKITVKNPDTGTEEADKQINLDELSFKSGLNDSNFDPTTTAGIKNIQQALAEMGFLDSQNITGIYGPITTEAVKKFQAQNGLPQTGFVGPLTKAKL